MKMQCLLLSFKSGRTSQETVMKNKTVNLVCLCHDPSVLLCMKASQYTAE